MKKVYLALLTSALLLSLSSCSTTNNGSGCGSKKGKVSIGTFKNRCAISVKFTNLHSSPIDPRISFLAFDSEGNTIGQHAVYFDKVSPNKSQTKTVSFDYNKCDMKKIKIESAKYSWGKYSFPVCGVHKKTYSWVTK